jgi:hypothetical protein
MSIDKPTSIEGENILVDEYDKLAFLIFPVLPMVIPTECCDFAKLKQKLSHLCKNLNPGQIEDEKLVHTVILPK